MVLFPTRQAVKNRRGQSKSEAERQPGGVREEEGDEVDKA